MGQIFDVYTIGHSNLSYEQFVTTLKENKIHAIADVRSSPYSRHTPHFNSEKLKSELLADGIRYVFLGKELGGRPRDKRFYCEGIADYEAMAKTEDFKLGIQRIIAGSERFRIALMCSEYNPIDCHRCLLVGRFLDNIGRKVWHIRSNDYSLSHAEVESRLLSLVKKNDSDLFLNHEDRVALAYRTRSLQVAYSDSAMQFNSELEKAK